MLARVPAGVVLGVAVLAVSPPSAEPAPLQDGCAGYDPTVVSTAALRCMELLPTGAAGDARGVVELGRVRSPFGIAVTAEGRQRYRLTLRVEGLPPVAAAGGSAYVAWATTPLLDPVIRLGTVENGTNDLGEIGLDKFLLLVSAEEDPRVHERRGPLVLRGGSPATRMHPEDLITRSPMALFPGGLPGGPASGGGHDSGGGRLAGDAERAGAEPEGGHGPVDLRAGEWWMPPMHPAVRPVPGMSALRPDVAPWLPGVPDPASLSEARPRRLERLQDGGSLELEARMVRRVVGSRAFVMLGFNGQIPGPLIHVPQGARITVRFRNATAIPLTIHWHGIRLENRYDGVPGLTQEAVLPGDEFRYEVVFPDAGIYWYHPHHREDVAQDLGLYGNLLVDPATAGTYDPVDREEVVMLDDLLVGEEGLVPYGEEEATHVMMGRFGNVMLVNGEPAYRLRVRAGDVVRFFLTNVANTRTFNLTLRPAGGGGPLRWKVIGTDVGLFERQAWAESVVIAPAERYIVEARFPEDGEYVLANEIQAIDHRSGGFFPVVTELGRVHAGDGDAVAPGREAAHRRRPAGVGDGEAAGTASGASFGRLREHPRVIAEIDAYRDHFDRPVDHELLLRLEVEEVPLLIEQLMGQDAVYFNPVEWEGTMPMMNWVSTGKRIAWHLVDPATGHEDETIDGWRFRVGDVVKIRIRNERHSFHAMQHPIHFHGQRFLVLEQDGVPNDNLAWKDTFLAPVGSTTDLLLELSNPGRWMIHCHIAEHLSAGMKMVFEVKE